MPLKLQGHELFVARLYDAKAYCSRTGQTFMTSFLTPYQQEIVKALCKDMHVAMEGGFANAERKIALISQQEPWYEVQADLCLLKADLVRPQSPLEHKDVLGALMHAGISREKIGDLVCCEDCVWIACKESMADFICQYVTQIKGEMVAFERAVMDQPPKISFETLQVHAASLRADCVVAALAHCSRSQAMECIRQGFVKINDVVLDQNQKLCHNDHVSIRHTGRFLFVRELGQTRKGRLVLEFKKYS